MVHWIWVLIALSAGACGGILLSALCVMARGEDIEDIIDRQTASGCICEREAVCSKQADAA